MVFSPVLGPGLREGSLRWLQTTRNLLNVAVTRARIGLIVVGDWEFCHNLPLEHCFRSLADYAAVQPERVVSEIKELSFITAGEVKIVGTIVGPVKREYARTTLRRFISSCFDYVWWVDTYFDNRVFELLWDVFQDADVKIRDVRLLAAEAAFESADDRPPYLTEEQLRTTSNEFNDAWGAASIAEAPFLSIAA